MKNISFVGVNLFFLTLVACGGSSGSDSEGMVIEGTLTQGDHEGAERASDPRVAHSAGEVIENVEICALGQCSITDATGQWGFQLPETFLGGEALFTVVGHGINSETVVTIPVGHSNVIVELVNGENGVEVHHVGVDGEETAEHEHVEEHQHS